MRKITITSRRTGFFDIAPICEIFIDNQNVGIIRPGKTESFDLDENDHSIYCSYNYAKYKTEKTNVIYISDSDNHSFTLGVVFAKTYMGRFKENFRTFFSKGYINVPDIELYE